MGPLVSIGCTAGVINVERDGAEVNGAWLVGLRRPALGDGVVNVVGTTGSIVEIDEAKGELVDGFTIGGLEDKGANVSAYGAGNGAQTLGKAFGGAIDGTGRVAGEGVAGKAAVFGCNKNNDIEIATTTNATIVAAITNWDGI